MNTDLYPRITIVTPNLNGDKYIEKTICSVLSQQYPNLEYIVIDGGSNDKSMDIICKFERYITFFVSEPDRGHAHALNKGFSRATGEVMGWINSDDLLLDRSLWTIADVFTKFSDVDWITSARPSVCDESGCITVLNYEGFSKRFFKRGGYSGQAYSTTWIQQESTFWRRSLWNRAGGQLDEALNFGIVFFTLPSLPLLSFHSVVFACTLGKEAQPNTIAIVPKHLVVSTAIAQRYYLG